LTLHKAQKISENHQ